MSFPGLLAQPALSFPALEVRGLSRILVTLKEALSALLVLAGIALIIVKNKR